MSGLNNLTELSQFRPKSALSRPNGAYTHLNMARLAQQDLTKRAPGIGMKRLVGMLLTNTARARRIMQPKVETQLQVLNPNGMQAVEITLPR